MNNQQKELEKYLVSIGDQFTDGRIFDKGDIIDAFTIGWNLASKNMLSWLEENIAHETSIIYSGVVHINYTPLFNKLKEMMKLYEET